MGVGVKIVHVGFRVPGFQVGMNTRDIVGTYIYIYVHIWRLYRDDML